MRLEPRTWVPQWSAWPRERICSSLVIGSGGSQSNEGCCGALRVPRECKERERESIYSGFSLRESTVSSGQAQ